MKERLPISSATPVVVVEDVVVDDVLLEPIPSEDAPTSEILKLTFWFALAPIWNDLLVNEPSKTLTPLNCVVDAILDISSDS